MISLISLAIVIGAVSYVALAPDKRTLAASRGAAGAVRGWRNVRRPSSKPGWGKKATRKGTWKVDMAPWRGALAGWHEGVRVARERRAEGHDLWMIGTRFAGRAWGGGESLVVGTRRLKSDLAAWRRRRQYAADGPVVQGSVVTDVTDATFTATDEPDASGNDDQQVVQGVVIDQDDEYVDPLTRIDRDLKQFNEDRTLTWAEIEANHGTPGRIWACFACYDLILQNDPRLPYAPDDPGKGSFFWVSDGWDCQVCGVLDDGPYARAFPVRADDDGTGPYAAPSPDDLAAQPAESAPAEGAGALTPTSDTTNPPVFAGITKEINTMNMQLTELTNVHELDSELEAIEGALEETMAGLGKIDEWANLLPERWEATDYSTKGLDEAIAGIPESFSIKAETSALLEQIAVARQEIKAAQEFGEMADSVGATGNVSGFRAS